MLFNLASRRASDDEAEKHKLRELAWLDQPWTVGGVEIRVMTVADYCTLWAIESPILRGRRGEAEDIAQFVWFLSTSYDPNDEAARELVFLYLAGHEAPDLAEEIAEYLDFIFVDEPPHTTGGKPSQTTFAGSIAHAFGTAYGWTRAESLTTPLPQALQLLNRAHDASPNTPKFTGKEAEYGALLRWLKTLPAEERAPIIERVNRHETIEIPE